MKKDYYPKNFQGFTLLEVIIAVFIIAVGVGGVAKIMPSLISGSSNNQSQLTAAYLAQEGIEIVRNIRDTNWLQAHNKGDSTPWNEGFTGCAAGCNVELDYICASVEDPKPADPANHKCFSAFSSSDFLKINASGFYNYDSGTATKYTRKITIFSDSASSTILVNVSWQDRGRSYNFPVQEKLYKYTW